MGGRRHGSRRGRIRGARVRAEDRFSARGNQVRRGVPAMTTGGRTIGVGMLGYAFMGKAHASAYRTLSHMTWPPPLSPELIVIGGRNAEAVGDAATRYGFGTATTDWRAIIADERVRLFDNAGPNWVHGEPPIAAALAGKHVICEKPLGRDADESYEIWHRVAATGVKHMCAFN